MDEIKCAHCGSIVEAMHEYEAEPEEGLPAFRLCKPCARLLCDKLVKNVEPYLMTVGYGAVAHTKRVSIVKNFIHQK